MAPNTEIPNIKKLREKYTYNIYPCAQPFCNLETSSEDLMDGSKQCPLPSRGGSYFFSRKKIGRSQNGKHHGHSEESSMTTTRKGVADSLEKLPMDVQLKKLEEHYAQVARQPSSITCNMELVPPNARAVCPQVKTNFSPLSVDTVPYAADVPLEVLRRSKEQSGSEALETLHKQRRKTFTISFASIPLSQSQEPPWTTDHNIMENRDLLRFVRHEYSKLSKRE